MKSRHSHVMQALRAYVGTLPPGKIAEIDELISLLTEAWPEIEGGDAASMQPWKLARMEDAEWNPPYLSFVIERHGATVKGSTYAELQQWHVDVHGGTAWCSEGGRRVVRERNRVDVEPLAVSVATAILARQEDNRLKWLNSQRSRVRVLIGLVIPDKGPKQTVQSRRSRFRHYLECRLQANDWTPDVAPNTYKHDHTASARGLRQPDKSKWRE